MNNGNGTFSEIGKMAGIADTDWSWSLLSADFDLDGFNDVYVTNGVFRDVIDRDKNNEILAILRSRRGQKTTKEDFAKFAQMLPQQKLTNYIFHNKGDYTFEDVSDTWVNSQETFSNGAAYADLDNDGDLDFVVNNINDVVNILKNNSIERSSGQFLQVSFKGPDKNINGVGAKVNLVMNDGSILTRQLINTRGFLSSVSNVLHFGINKDKSINSMEVIWPDGKSEKLSSISTNQKMVLDYANASVKQKKADSSIKLFTELPLNYSHIDPYFNDYERQVLLPHKLSQTGPGIAKADLNNDGLEDIYFGGAYKQAGVLMMANKSGKFDVLEVDSFIQDKNHEDVGAAFFDADNDGDMDLYVVSGGYEFERLPKLLLDRLYINQGNGKFVKDNGALDMFVAAGSVVVPSDYDNDGDIDLFVGGRVIPSKYPYPPTSYLLINDKGKFTVGTPSLAPELAEIGMVTSAEWSDINKDGKIDLIVTGEWMGIVVFLNENNRLVRSDKYSYLNNETGWWNRILLADVDKDGDMDIVAGNLGINYKFHASKEKPFHAYTRDFDFNGVEDIFLAIDYQGKQVPVRGKGYTAQQLPHLAQKIPTYTAYANMDLVGILGAGIESALHYQAVEFRSGIFLNDGQGNFTFNPFENEVQRSPINSIIYDDLDGDGLEDLLLAGNNYQSEIQTTRADGGIGAFLKGDGKGGFVYKSNLLTGFFADGDVRDMIEINLGKTKYIMVTNNNSKPNLFRIKK
ncbi:VCBS repeat-containing protein [Aureibaculum algae]|uniref:VCBS repeat-containing protein n=1 Tax=Aureibaculum algae TaxID=2584122 RepID=UPI00202A3B33|nr:VCBS repeat-containing protein [Aureibaculum algae]